MRGIDGSMGIANGHFLVGLDPFTCRGIDGLDRHWTALLGLDADMTCV